MDPRPCRTIGAFLIATLWSAAGLAAPPHVDVYRLRTPGDAGDINQASDLCWGEIADRKGLWTCCDRNGGASAGRIYFFSPATLHAAAPGEKLVADEEFVIAPPAEGWEAFASAQRPFPADRLDAVRTRLVSEQERGDEPYLDLEAITIAPGATATREKRLFVVSEEPFSTVLELQLERPGGSHRATLVGLHAYMEKPEEQGTARNDGLEGLAYAGAPGRFYFCEEGTRDTQGRAGALLLFLDPRLGAAELRDHVLAPQTESTDRLTAAVRARRSGSSQTLNGISPRADGTLLLLDRNGALIHRVDPASASVTPWLNLYDMEGVDLRQVLAHLPHDRHLPYISIEGIAEDDAGNLWMCDDPAIPEGFRESVMLRVRATDLPPVPSTRPSGTAPAREKTP